MVEATIAKCKRYRLGVDEAADEKEFLIRNQADLDRQLLFGQVEHHCDEVKRVLTKQAQQHVAGVENKLCDNCNLYTEGLHAEATLTKETTVRETVA